MFTNREKNTAIKKQAILKALLIRIKTEDFDKIKIRDICKDSSVSEASFYNYFSKKSDLFVYFVQLWTVETHWKLIYEKKVDGLNAISLLFEDVASFTVKHPEAMAEIISLQAKWKTKIDLPLLTNADKVIAFPDYDKVENIASKGLDSILIPHLEIAIKNGELPLNAPVEVITLTLKSIFFGIPIFLKETPVDKINDIYKEQLSLLWLAIKKQYSN